MASKIDSVCPEKFHTLFNLFVENREGLEWVSWDCFRVVYIIQDYCILCIHFTAWTFISHGCEDEHLFVHITWIGIYCICTSASKKSICGIIAFFAFILQHNLISHEHENVFILFELGFIASVQVHQEINLWGNMKILYTRARLTQICIYFWARLTQICIYFWFI